MKLLYLSVAFFLSSVGLSEDADLLTSTCAFSGSGMTPCFLLVFKQIAFKLECKKKDVLNVITFHTPCPALG